MLEDIQAATQHVSSIIHPKANERDIHHDPKEKVTGYQVNSEDEERYGELETKFERAEATHFAVWHQQGQKNVSFLLYVPYNFLDMILIIFLEDTPHSIIQYG